MSSTVPLHSEGRSDVDEYALKRMELDRVLASGIFGSSSNAARILRFICERALENSPPPSEYEIGVGALDRRPDFDPRDDSIVRVEMHRVRKRLKQYYEEEGASHPVSIVIPPRQYTPSFVLRGQEESSASTSGTPPAALVHRRRRSGAFWVLAIFILAAICIGVFLWRTHIGAQLPANSPRQLASVANGGAVRILAGNSQELTDRDGNLWMSDRFFSGGSTAAVRYRSLSFGTDPAIYSHRRYGYDFSYKIPLSPGNYEMRLYFAESSEAGPIIGETGDNSRVFVVTANDKRLLPILDHRHLGLFDVIADADGPDSADVKVFKDITPARDGFLHLHFLAHKQTAFVNAIVLVPGLKGKMLPLRWRASDTPYRDHAGHLWLSDRYYRGGRLSRFTAITRNTVDPDLFSGERFGNFRYRIPVAPGRYTVILYFSENFHTVWDHTAGTAARLFQVFGNGNTLLRNFDIFSEARGANIALVKRFKHIEDNSLGKIELHFEPGNDYATLDAIEIEDESR